MDTKWVQSTFLGSTLRIAGSVGGGLVVLVALAVLLGVIGVPGVASVENRFGTVNDSTTVVETEMTVSNPNPLGISLSDTTVDYTVRMNDVPMATGQRAGLSIGAGNSTLSFRTYMRHDRIQPWWHSHVENRERTAVVIDAVVRAGLLDDREFGLPQKRTIETDLLGQFNSSETRRIDADRPFPSDPVLFVNETSATWNRAELSAERTPIAMTFRAYNPKRYPYAISELGYTITMNGVRVGDGSSQDVTTLLPRTAGTIRAALVIQNRNLDDWWVTHLRKEQVTELEIQFYAVVDPAEDAVGGGLGDTGSFEIPLDPLDYRTTIETDMFGNKNGTVTGSADAGDDGSDRPTPPAPGDETTDESGGSAATTADDGQFGDGGSDGGLLD